MSSTNIRRLFSLTLIVSKIVPWKKELFPCKTSSFLLTPFPKEYQACENSRKIQRHSQNIWNHAQLTSFCSHCSRTGCRTVTKFPVLHQKGSVSSSSGLKRVTEKPRFRDGLVWTAGLTVKKKTVSVLRRFSCSLWTATRSLPSPRVPSRPYQPQSV